MLLLFFFFFFFFFLSTYTPAHGMRPHASMRTHCRMHAPPPLNSDGLQFTNAPPLSAVRPSPSPGPGPLRGRGASRPGPERLPPL